MVCIIYIWHLGICIADVVTSGLMTCSKYGRVMEFTAMKFTTAYLCLMSLNYIKNILESISKNITFCYA